MVSIAFVSGKGGTGKTLVAVNLSILLSTRRKVLLIDADVKGGSSASHLLGLGGIGPTLKDLLLGDSVYDWDDAVHRSGNLDFIPTGADLELIWRNVEWNKLASVVRKMRSYDYVFFDGPAQFEEGFMGVMQVAEYYVIVLTPTPGGIESAMKIRFIGRKIGTKPLGFILNQPNVSFRNASEVARLIEKRMYIPSLAPEHNDCRCLGILPHDKAEFISRVRGKPIVIFDPRSKLSRALHQIALRIEGEPATEKSLFSRISSLFSRKHP